MYQNSTSTYMMHHQLPSPDYTGDSDSDSDIVHEIEQKRRQLDEEIAKFKAKKDQEFRDFKQDLRARKRDRQDFHPSSSNAYFFTRNPPSNTPPTHAVHTTPEKQARKHTRSASNRQSEPFRLMKPSSSSRVTPPTLCLDKLNIAGEQMPTAQLHSPPPPYLSSAQPSIRHSKEKAKTSPPKDIVAIKSLRDRPKDTFAVGLTSSFLPLLEKGPMVEDDSSDHVEETQTAPASPNEKYLEESAATIRSSSLPSDISMSPGFQVAQTKRAYTAPSGVSRRVLAPIIRNVNGRSNHGRKRKHVTFQLADRAIVQPSSSYEEGPSPGLEKEEEKEPDSDENGKSRADPAPLIRRMTPRGPLGQRKEPASGVTTPEEDIGMGMGDLMLAEDDEPAEFAAATSSASTQVDGYFALKHQHPERSPASASPQKVPLFQTLDDDRYLPRRHDTRKLQQISVTSPAATPESPHDLHVTIDDTAVDKIGFFELDEELASPNAGVPKPFDHVEEVEDVNLELNLSPPSRTADAAGRDVPVLDEKHGLGITETGTSVPINIVRPLNGSISNSWIGTFGH